MTTVLRLKKANMRATQNRIQILDLIETNGTPMSHSEMLDALGSSVDRVTLYRTLDAFVEKKLIHRVQGIDGVWRFCSHENDSERCPGGHAHFLCESCGKMTCLLDLPMPHVSLPESFEIRRKQFLISGICPKCQSNADTTHQ